MNEYEHRIYEASARKAEHEAEDAFQRSRETKAKADLAVLILEHTRDALAKGKGVVMS